MCIGVLLLLLSAVIGTSQQQQNTNNNGHRNSNNNDVNTDVVARHCGDENGAAGDGQEVQVMPNLDRLSSETASNVCGGAGVARERQRSTRGTVSLPLAKCYILFCTLNDFCSLCQYYFG